jgi:hypothetical protein
MKTRRLNERSNARRAQTTASAPQINPRSELHTFEMRPHHTPAPSSACGIPGEQATGAPPVSLDLPAGAKAFDDTHFEGRTRLL